MGRAHALQGRASRALLNMAERGEPEPESWIGCTALGGSGVYGVERRLRARGTSPAYSEEIEYRLDRNVRIARRTR